MRFFMAEDRVLDTGPRSFCFLRRPRDGNAPTDCEEIENYVPAWKNVEFTQNIYGTRIDKIFPPDLRIYINDWPSDLTHEAVNNFVSLGIEICENEVSTVHLRNHIKTNY